MARSTGVTKTKVMQGLWVGDRLPTMQQISIASFLANGHEFHLYTYSKLRDVPEGTVIRDAEEIIPRSQVFRNAKANTFAAFSDFFRYKLLLDRGCWWVDVDMVCLRPFLFDDEYVFSSELDLCRERTNSGVIKTPMGSELVAYTWDVCQKKDKQNLAWDEVGPESDGRSGQAVWAGTPCPARNYVLPPSILSLVCCVAAQPLLSLWR